MNTEQKHKTLEEHDELKEKLEETRSEDAGKVPLRVYGDNQDLTPREHSNILHILSAD